MKTNNAAIGEVGDIPKTEIPVERWVEPEPVVVTAREKALEQCIDSYEEAMGLVLARATEAEKEAKQAKNAFIKLVRIVTFNAKNAKTILAQVGITLKDNK